MMYADDLLLFKPVSCQQGLLTFQHDVNLISQWSIQNHLSLNSNKTKYMLISRSRPGTCNYVLQLPNLCEQQSNWKSSSVTNTWGSGYLMILLGRSTSKVSVTDCRDWVTSSEHFPCTALRTPFSTYMQDSVTHSGVCLHSMGPPPQEWPTTPSVYCQTGNKILVSKSGIPVYQPQLPITDEPSLISQTYFCL